MTEGQKMQVALPSGSTKANAKTPAWERTHVSPYDADVHLPNMAFKVFSYASKISSAKDPVTGRWKPGKFWASQKSLAEDRYGIDESTITLAVAFSRCGGVVRTGGTRKEWANECISSLRSRRLGQDTSEPVPDGRNLRVVGAGRSSRYSVVSL
jgi:hypothetical protein